MSEGGGSQNNIGHTLQELLGSAESTEDEGRGESDWAEPHNLTLICGTFFIMEDVRKFFKIEQEVDFD